MALDTANATVTAVPLPLKDLANCLLAGAAGDCIGGPFEGATVEVVGLPDGRWRISDDTVLSVVTARACLSGMAVDPAIIAAAFSEEFSSNGIPGLGASTLKAMRDLRAGVHWALAGRKGEHAAGNGAAMRIAPLAFFLDVDKPSHRRTIRDVCRITHHNDEAYVAALAVLRAMQLPSDSNDALAMIAGDLPDTNVRDVLMTLAELPDNATAKQAATISGTSGYAPESVPLAVFIATNANSLESGIFSSVECGGDTDTIASMVGHILGARGHNVPVEWLVRLPCTEAIEALCEDLAH